MAQTQFRLISGVRDEQVRGRVRVMELSKQVQGSTRTGKAKTGLLCTGKEWPKQGQNNRDRSKPGKSRTGS